MDSGGCYPPQVCTSVYVEEHLKMCNKIMGGRKADSAGNYSWLGVLLNKCEDAPYEVTPSERTVLEELRTHPDLEKCEQTIVFNYFAKTQ